MKRVLNVLVACECSGVVRSAFRALGHNAISCDLLPAEDGSCHHIQGDAIETLRYGYGIRPYTPWDLVIAHPPCTRMSLSGALRLYLGGKKHNGPNPEKWAELERATAFFRSFFEEYDGPLCVENPLMHGHALRRIGELPGVTKQTVQPYEFGDDASKRTVLWLRGLPPLKHDPRQMVVPRFVGGLPRWANQTDSGQNRLPPSEGRAAARAVTYPGLAKQFAAKWSEFLTSKTN